MQSFFSVWAKISVPWRRLRAAVKRRTCYWVIGSLLMSILIVTFLPSSTNALDYQILDLFQNLLRPFRAHHPDMFLIGIDTDTLAHAKERWPWPRERFAQLVEVIAKGQPRILIWDFALDHLEQENGSPGDQRLAEAFRKAGLVALVSTINSYQTIEGLQKRLFRNVPLFRKVASFEGFACCVVDDDGVFRRFIIRDENLGADSCALQVFQGLSGKTCHLPPFNEVGQTSCFLAFATRGGDIPSVKAVDLLRGAVSPALLKNKIVVVGATAPVLQDYHLTSRGTMAGPRILATALDTMLQHRVARVEDGWPARLVAVSLGCLGGILLAGLVVTHPVFWSGIGLALATVGWALIMGLVLCHI
ncbi:MAG: CHASE2 domain-containing protein [Erysipelotrichia bacterium]|nr:CHASE2 domain-containing protein [Erysipelotrichia bacterium]